MRNQRMEVCIGLLHIFMFACFRIFIQRRRCGEVRVPRQIGEDGRKPVQCGAADDDELPPVRVETNGTFYVELSDEKGSPSDRDLPYGEIADAFASGDGNFWIGLTPGDYSELAPRQKLASVPRALHAVSASKIESLKADALKADAFTAGTATVGTLTVTNAFRLTETRDLIAEEGKTLEISAVNDIKILNSIWITTKYDVNIGSGTASSDMIIIWKSPTATGGTPAALFYPKGATLENLGGFAIVYKLGE